MTRHRRRALWISILVGVSAMLLSSSWSTFWGTAETETAQPAPTVVASLPPLSSLEEHVPTQAAVVRVAPVEEESDERAESDAEARERLLASPIIRDRLIAIDRMNVATARFSHSVDESQIEVEDMNQSVVDLFDSARLEPVLSEGGAIEGLEIVDLDSESPFLEAGLRPGDLITHLNGSELFDPADLPALLIRLERSLSLCVERDGRELCRAMSLD